MKKNHSAYSSRTILLVDDAPTVALYAGVFRESYRVLAISSVDEAGQILSRENPEIAVVEPSIGGEQGWEWVRSIIQTHAVPTIICSTLDDRKMGREAGASAYLIKPVSPATLFRTVASLLDKVP
jgi:DNA-binding response OmpR family regulator